MSQPDVIAEMMSRGWNTMGSAPKDGTVVRLLIEHPNYHCHLDLRWLDDVEAHWIEHNGGGWTWYGMFGKPRAWRSNV